MKIEIVELDTHITEKPEEGCLAVFEENRNIPFHIKRSYYIYGVQAGEERGFHAHRTLQQFLYCPYGSVTISLSDGKDTIKVILDQANKGLLLEPGLWRVMHWNIDNSVLCVAASDYYNADDYIRDYDEFLNYKRNLNNFEG